MPELPEITIYLEPLERRIVGAAIDIAAGSQCTQVIELSSDYINDRLAASRQTNTATA